MWLIAGMSAWNSTVFSQHLLPLLNGERDRDVLLEALVDMAKKGALILRSDDEPVSNPGRVRQIMVGELERKLRQLGPQSIMIN